ncbi:helix-turn-helix transcriptional regulator [Botrimarina mediterranea]|uniref:helix-turn-helix transcriptional regulator n=1 Tax=Botrimarina mediterranea TaxID=2528022 RepID=UPI0011AA3B7F|nr:WYL domain-containing protein [Botrimarina mediterranea]
MNVKRITRLIDLLQRLQSGQGGDADGLAEACGVSRRTVFRDIESLREAGVPIEYDADAQRYRIDAAHFLPPTNLTLEEALSVVLLAGRVGELERDTLFAAAIGAAEKIEASLPSSMRERLSEVAEAIDLRPPPVNPLADKGDVYRALLRASVDQQAVRIRYDCRTEFREIETDLDPYHLLFQERSWYVIGRSSRHDEVRTFNIGRVKAVEPTGASFKRPPSFSVKKHLRNAWRLIPDDGPDSEVHLRFSAVVSRNVAEVLWHPTQRCEFRDDGSLDYHVTVSGIREIVWWVLGYGDQVEVLKPERLRREVARRHRAAAERYGVV